MKHVAVGQDPCHIKSVLVIDDHPLYCDALVVALSHVFNGCRIETATTLGDGIKHLKPGFEPDLVLLDLKLPDVTGLSGFLRLREKLVNTPILVISALTSAEIVYTLMDAGAAGFIQKDVSAQVLRDALIEVRSGRKYLPPEHRRTYRPSSRPAEVQDITSKIAELTPQQTRIMKLICAGKPNKQIAYELSLAEATVKAHITALLRRLGVQNRTQAAVLVESASLGGAAENGEIDARAFLSQ